MAPLPPEFEALVRPRCDFLEADTPIDPGRSFMDLGVDSLRLMAIIVEVESTYQIVVPDAVLTLENLASPAALWQAVSALLPGVDDDAGRR